MAEKEMQKKQMMVPVTYIIIAVLAVAVISLVYVLISNPNALQQSLQRTSVPTEGGQLPITKVTGEQQAGQAVTEIGTDIKALSSTLDEIDQSLK